MFKAQKFIISLAILISFVTSQNNEPFELDIRTRLVNNSRTMVNIQITNLMDKPLDYVEGFVIEKDPDKNLIDEKRIVLVYGYEPPLQKGFSTTRSISFEKPKKAIPNSYNFLISKIRFIGESRVFTWHPDIGFIRID
jgi:hypothetical protein|tara:strand:- start:237 stop:650 length:414 start_codon:yes stop_codon:yes gene_type:complete